MEGTPESEVKRRRVESEVPGTYTWIDDQNLHTLQLTDAKKLIWNAGSHHGEWSFTYNDVAQRGTLRIDGLVGAGQTQNHEIAWRPNSRTFYGDGVVTVFHMYEPEDMHPEKVVGTYSWISIEQTRLHTIELTDTNTVVWNNGSPQGAWAFTCGSVRLIAV